MSGSQDGPAPLGRSAVLALVWLCAACSSPIIDDFILPGVQIASAHAGADQSAVAGQAVPIAPAIRIVDDEGSAVQGVYVWFVVTGGGGTVSGAHATTDSAGVAAVGSWTLGTVGPNTVEARVSTASSGNPVVFTATGLEAATIR